MRTVRAGLVVLTLTAGMSAAIPTAADAATDKQRVIVVFDDSVSNPKAVASEQAKRHGGAVKFVYSNALKGWAGTIRAGDMGALMRDKGVRSVELDGVMTISATQSPTPSWGLDRIDQINRIDPAVPSAYTYNSTGSGVTAYVIDTGIRITNGDFGGRATSGINKVGTDSSATDDCNGHGTHVAGTIGGATYGVAKGVNLVAVRVLDCSGSGSTSGVIAGIDWVTQNHTTGKAVANMSLGGGASTAMDTAVRNSIAAGIVYSIAAGNSGNDACRTSPARVTEAITVGASDSADRIASFSNIGPCLDLFAPGVGITSDWITSPTNTISGTSMAAPHVAGVAALCLASANATCSNSTATAVRDAIVNRASPDKVTGMRAKDKKTTVNRLLYAGGL
jgi:subtilisin family serine protease